MALKSGESKTSDYMRKKDGCLYFKDRLYVPDNRELRDLILKESHSSVFYMHPGSNKMYKDLKCHY